MANRDQTIARKVGLRFVLWGCIGVLAVASVPFGGPHRAVWFASHMPLQVLTAVTTLTAIVWFAAPCLARPIMRRGAFVSAPVAASAFVLAAAAGSIVNLILSPRPGEPEPVHDYFIKPMFWLAFLGGPLAAGLGAFLRRSLSRAGYGSGAA